MNEKTVFYMKNDRRKYHVVKVITLDNIDFVIYKYYGIHKKWWHYKLERLEDIQERFDIGLYSYKKGVKGE